MTNYARTFDDRRGMEDSRRGPRRHPSPRITTFYRLEVRMNEARITQGHRQYLLFQTSRSRSESTFTPNESRPHPPICSKISPKGKKKITQRISKLALRSQQGTCLSNTTHTELAHCHLWIALTHACLHRRRCIHCVGMRKLIARQSSSIISSGLLAPPESSVPSWVWLMTEGHKSLRRAYTAIEVIDDT